VLSSFVLNGDGSNWTLEHQLPIPRIWSEAGGNKVEPRIGVINPLNASIITLIIGTDSSVAIDMATGNVLDCLAVEEVEVGCPGFRFSSFLKPCLLPQWLESSGIPSAGILSSHIHSSVSN
jgi:hypothetical protein